ncbi:AMP-binding protein [Streptomyces sp. NPDC026672]|uniref:AMP-binding protein n=1 Tax=unclassified Streptomyces TaxID=2593676 RepID=UPI0033CC09BD
MFRAELVRPLHELLAGHAEQRPRQVAFRDACRSVTYAELHLRTARIAGHLAELGLERGDRAVIHLPNRVEAVESYLAVARASAVGVPLDPQSTDAELALLLDDCAPTLMITGADRLPQVRRVLADRPGVTVVVVRERAAAAGPGDPAGPGDDHGLPEFEALAATWSIRRPARDDLGLDEPAWVTYTAGTTGRPKGVVSTQRSSLWATAACTVPLLGLSPDDRVLWSMPFHHAVTHGMGVLGVLAVGATARMTADDIVATAREERSTFLVGVPAMYRRMVERARSGGADDDLPELRLCMVAGAPCPVSLHEAFRAAFGIRLVDSYGSTETGGAITTNLPEGPHVPGSCGLPVPGLTLRLTDPRTGEEVPRGAEGEVWVSSPALMHGYHRQQEATAAVLADGWYRTGDIAWQDEAGFVTISGRRNELIIRGGENIHPGEIEAVLARVDGVADAAVAARPHEVLGEVPVAYLVAGPGGIDTDAVLTACRAELSAHKLPVELHEVDEVPRNPAGKIYRRRLAGLAGRLLWRSSRAADRSVRGYEDALDLGLLDSTHPLLQAVIELPGDDALSLSGRLRADGDTALPVHDLAGTPVLAPAALVDLVLHAGRHAGCGRLVELTAHEPLELPAHEGVQLRVGVGTSGTDGVRRVTVHARREGPGDGTGVRGRPWTLHAAGTLAPEPVVPASKELDVWPPADARPVAPEELAGGTVPPELRTLWRRDGELLAEVALRDDARDRAAAFGLHPVLLDALLRLPLPPVPHGDPSASAGPSWRPGSWYGVSLHASGASALRVHLRPRSGGGFGIEAADRTGAAVLTVERMTPGT